MSRGPYPVMLMLAMALPGAARALGLGEIRVDSGLNEPLSAQIDIVGATRDDLAALTAKVAGRDVFQHYGADRPAFLASATFKVGLDAQGSPVLNIRSADAFTDPVIDFLVDISWGKGELIREYSLLLDPPGFGPATRTTEVAAARAAPAPLATGVAPAARAPSTRTAASAPPDAAVIPYTADSSRARQAPSATAITPSRLRVAAGDTLRGIARRAGSRTEADAQRLMIAIFRANPQAFEGNINLLHSGAELRIPSGPEVEAIDAAVASREVRSQTTVWLQDGRSATPHPVVAAATAHSSAPAPLAEQTSPAQELRMRVQSLEQTLDAAHRELAAQDARIQDLKQLTSAQAASQPAASLPKASQPTASPPTASQAAAALPAASPPAAALPAASPPAAALPAASPPAAPLLSTVQAGPPAAPVTGATLHAELMQSQPHPVPVLTPVAPPPAAPPLVNEAQLGSMAAALAVLLGGFAYVRRRLVRAGAELPRTPIGYVPPDVSPIERPEPQGPRQQPAHLVAAPLSSSPEQLGPTTGVAAPDVMATTAPLAVLADPFDTGHTVALGAGPALSLDAGRTVSLAPRVAPEIPRPTPADDDTDYMGIDTQALERSYLEGLAIDSMAVDTASHKAVPYDPAKHGAASDDTASHPSALHDTASHEAIPYDPSLSDEAAQHALDALAAASDLQTLALDRPTIDTRKADLTPLKSTTLDYNLLDLDATAHHVNLSGNQHDQPHTVERRMNLVDVLKSAIERDPHRRDLVLKLLETYYGVVSTNQRAFLDVVRKLPQDLDFLTKEDWRKVQMMGRHIAPRDPLFAGDTKDDLLPSFA